MQREIKQTWRFSRSQQEVWEYLTKPELLELWLAKTDFQPVVGHRFHMDGKDGCLIDCEVLEIKPFAKLCYSWRTSSKRDHRPFDSLVVWTLVPHADGTELHLVHSGFVAAEDHSGHNAGWTLLVGHKMAELLKPATA
jgi:uncharacterized protein YndB with AHSA1/START domain